jgi:predicted RNase H-like HicB family nuclease
MTTYEFTIVLETGDDGWIVATCPALNAVSQGSTREEAVANVQEAMALCIEDMRASGEQIPVNQPVSTETVAVAV